MLFISKIKFDFIFVLNFLTGIKDREVRRGSVHSMAVLVLLSEMDLLTKKKYREMDEITCLNLGEAAF